MEGQETFIGMRPLKIFVQEDTIIIFCPNTPCVSARGVTCYKRDAQVFYEIKIVRNMVSHYEPTLCLDVSDDQFPVWYVATKDSDFDGNVKTVKLGSVDVTEDTTTIHQDVIGSYDFDVLVKSGGNQYGLYGTISDDCKTIVTEDGRVFETGFSQEDIDSGFAPKPGSFVRFNVYEVFEYE